MAKTLLARIDAENDYRRVTRPRLRIIVKETRRYPTGYLRAQSGTTEYDCGSREVGYETSTIPSGLWLIQLSAFFVRPAAPSSGPVQRPRRAAPPTPRPTRNPRAMPGAIPVLHISHPQPDCGGDTGSRHPPIPASSMNRKQPKQPTAVVLTAKHRKTIVRCFGALLPPASLAAIRLGGAGRRGAARRGT